MEETGKINISEVTNSNRMKPIVVRSLMFFLSNATGPIPAGIF
jgi:hypothetical protein